MVLALFNHVLASEERGLAPKHRLASYRISRNLCLLVTGIFVLSTAPSLGSTVLLSYQSGGETVQLSIRSVMWIASLFLGWSRRLIIRTSTGSKESGKGAKNMEHPSLPIG